jgi:hypothetical protein
VAVGIVFLILAVAIGLTAGLGAGLFAIVPIALMVLFLGWAAVAFASGRSPGRAVRETHRPELLGPGGPDDPDAR